MMRSHPNCPRALAPSARNSRARSYRDSCGRKPPLRKFSPVKASHDVTTFQAARPAERWSERGELTRNLERLVEGGVDGPRQTDALGDRRQGCQHGERVGTAHDVEVVDPTVLFAQPQALGEEEEVELRSFGRLRQFDERGEFDMAPSGGVTPHSGVVDARESALPGAPAWVRRDVRASSYRQRNGWSGEEPEAGTQRGLLIGRADAASGRAQFSHHFMGDGVEVVRNGARTEPVSLDAGGLPLGEQVDEVRRRAGEDQGVGAQRPAVEIDRARSFRCQRLGLVRRRGTRGDRPRHAGVVSVRSTAPSMLRTVPTSARASCTRLSG